MNKNFIPCAKFIKRGVAKANPEVLQLSKNELRGILNKAKSNILETSENVTNFNQNAGGVETSCGDQFNMEDYDKEDDAQCLFDVGNLMSVDDSEEANSEVNGEDEEIDSEKEDDEIKPSDNLIAVGHSYGDVSLLDVYVYNEEADDLYVHHDIMLPTIPLAMEWLSFAPSSNESGNFLAVGGITPEITIWDLDVVNSLEPVFKLGEYSNKKKYQHRNHGHRDAVLDLSWNARFNHVLASGSVDRSVLLWDLNKARATSKFTEFQEKVQSLDWHPYEENVLVAGACDGTVTLVDCRMGETLNFLRVDGEVEKVCWCPSNQFNVLVATSKGALCYADCRIGKLLWKSQAHEKELTGLAVHMDCIVTSSTDQTIKMWNLSSGELELINTKNTNQGEIQCLEMCPENPYIVCVGGNSRDNNFKVYNLSK